jgi:hypothetical protein
MIIFLNIEIIYEKFGNLVEDVFNICRREGNYIVSCSKGL